MAETTLIDNIGTDGFENVTNLVIYDKTNVYISGKNTESNYVYSLAQYKLSDENKLYGGPNYVKNLIKTNIRSVSVYDKKLLIVPVDEFTIYLSNPIGIGKYELKVWNNESKTHDPIFNYICDPIILLDNKVNSYDLKLMQVIIVNETIYVFVQSNLCNKKKNNLFILKGSIMPTSETCNKLSLNQNFKVQTFYNLYKTGKSAGLDKETSSTVMFNSVTFNNVDTFILLFVCGHSGSNGFLAKSKLFLQFDSMSANLTMIKKISNLHELYFLSNKPRGISFIDDGNFMIITNNKQNGLTKYMIVKICE